MSAATARAALARRGLLASLGAAVIGSLAACTGGASEPTTAAPRVTQLRIVGLIVADVNRSLTFYHHLGLDLPSSVDGRSYRHRSDNGDVLFWEEPSMIRSFDPTWSPPMVGDRRVVLEFGFPSSARLSAVYDELQRRYGTGRLAPFDQGGGVRYAIVVDPDGNQVSLRYPATG